MVLRGRRIHLNHARYVPCGTLNRRLINVRGSCIAGRRGYAWKLEPGDVPEDIAADRLATPLVSPLLARTRAATGRVNLAAEVPGLLRVDIAKINRLNTIDESLTIGTLPDYAVVAPKDLVATVKNYFSKVE